jgi:succinoglycan biosynthesis transport protein ExoP
MRPAQLQIREAIAAIRRRWKLILIPAVAVTILSIIGVHFAPKKYESSTTILVRRSKVPLTGYEVPMAFEDQLRNFNEILWSQPLLNALADSLGLTAHARSEIDRLAISQTIRGSFSTALLGSDSFRITYYDTDPVRAQRAARVIAELFIQMQLSLENRQNALTVEFYEKKVQEYRAAFDSSVQSLVSAIKQNVGELPQESRSLSAQLDEIQRNIALNDSRMNIQRSALGNLGTLLEKLHAEPDSLPAVISKQAFLDLQRDEVPFASELRSLLARYEDMLRRYTGNYPDVQKLGAQMIEHLERMRKGGESEIARLEVQRDELEKDRARVIEELKQSSTVTRMNTDKESSYDIDRKLYNDMQVNLEQARLAQELGSQGANQFIVIDPAYLPTKPAKSKSMLVMVGFGLGLLLGVLAAVVAELLDTTVRRPRDIEIYQKPVIALLPEGRRD